MRSKLHLVRPTEWLQLTGRRPDKFDPDFSVGELRALRWQLWWSKYLPYRTYPLIPFRKVVYWNWRKRKLTLPRPWAKDPLRYLGEGD